MMDAWHSFQPLRPNTQPLGRRTQEERNKEATDGAIIMTSLESADPWLFPVNAEEGVEGRAE